MKTLLLVIAFLLISSTAHANDAKGILAALQSADGALADILSPVAESSMAPLDTRVARLADNIRETRPIEVTSSVGPQAGNTDRIVATAK